MKNIIDILIYESGDGGDFRLVNGDLDTISSLTNQVYLALFGGNIEQSTTADIEDGEIREDWWGNELLDIPYNSDFERTLNNVVLNSYGLKQLEDAGMEDMKYFTDFADITTTASTPEPDKLVYKVTMTQKSGEKFIVKFVWDNLKMIEYDSTII